MNGLIGAAVVRLSQDPEKKYTQGGTSLLKLNGALLDAKAAHGTAAEWLSVSVWGDLADSLADCLKKGDEIYVEGRVRLRTYQTASGETRASLEMSAWLVQPLGLIGKNAPAYRSKVTQSEREHADRGTDGPGTSPSFVANSREKGRTDSGPPAARSGGNQWPRDGYVGPS